MRQPTLMQLQNDQMVALRALLEWPLQQVQAGQDAGNEAVEALR